MGQYRLDQLEVAVRHPRHFVERVLVPRSHGVERDGGQTVYELRVPLVPPEYWPQITLEVRDAQTLEQLEDVELHCVSTSAMALWRQPGPRTPYGSSG